MQNQSQFQTSPNNGEAAQRAHHPGWTPMPLEHLPLPTYWPSGLAFAITLIFWGIITSWVILTVGLLVFIISLAGWIQDIRHERKHAHASSSH
jgi:hypothetical protein